MTKQQIASRQPYNFSRRALICGIVLAWWVCGCASRSHHDQSSGGTETLLPKLTSVITGPAALALTNCAGFQADFTLSFEDTRGTPTNLSGQIFGRGGKLFLESADKSKSAGTTGFGVIWDVSNGQGYAFSEALQGYAPIGGAVHVTNLLMETAAEPAQRIEGHLVRSVNMTAGSSNGQMFVFELARARDADNLPVMLRSLNQPHALTLTLTKIQLIVPAEDLFLPPDGFTKYASESALLSELETRQQEFFSREHEIPGNAGEHNNQGDHHSAAPE
jgi:hypothetical protein